MRFAPETAQDRRRFLQSGSVLLALPLWSNALGLAAEEKPAEDKTLPPTPHLRIALLTDIHYADREPRINRYYRESLDKLAVFVIQCQLLKPDFAVELGDMIDSSRQVDDDRKLLQTINAAFQKSATERHYILGNHCVETLTKQEFLDAVGQKDSYYSFDKKGYHFIVLDACFRKDGVPYERNNFVWTDSAISKEELDWLREDLRKSSLPTIVFTHQCLDVGDQYGVSNAEAVRKILEEFGQVKLVLQGHFHRGRQQTLGGIPYGTLSAVVEGTGQANNAFAFLDIHADGRMVMMGYYKQEPLSI